METSVLQLQDPEFTGLEEHSKLNNKHGLVNTLIAALLDREKKTQLIHAQKLWDNECMVF